MKRFHIEPISGQTYAGHVSETGEWVNFYEADNEIARLITLNADLTDTYNKHMSSWAERERAKDAEIERLRNRLSVMTNNYYALLDAPKSTHLAEPVDNQEQGEVCCEYPEVDDDGWCRNCGYDRRTGMCELVKPIGLSTEELNK